MLESSQHLAISRRLCNGLNCLHWCWLFIPNYLLQGGQKSVKSCPLCQQPLQQIMRYGRPMNQAKVQQADIKFALSCSTQLRRAAKTCAEAGKAAADFAGRAGVAVSIACQTQDAELRSMKFTAASPSRPSSISAAKQMQRLHVLVQSVRREGCKLHAWTYAINAFSEQSNACIAETMQRTSCWQTA